MTNETNNIDHTAPELGEVIQILTGCPRVAKDKRYGLHEVIGIAGPVCVRTRRLYDGAELDVDRRFIDRIDARLAGVRSAPSVVFEDQGDAELADEAEELEELDGAFCSACGMHHAEGECDLDVEDEADELVVVVPCGGAKLDHAAPAGELYVGSYHRACRRAAAALGGRVVILSAKYGFVGLDEELEPYELRIDEAGAIDEHELERSARRLGLVGARRVVVLAGGAYTRAARSVFPDAEAPLVPSRGIGEQLARLKRIASSSTAVAA